MNYIKLQQDLIKAANNRDEKGKAFNGFYLKRECETIIGPNRSQAVIIPNDDVYIDLDKVLKVKKCRHLRTCYLKLKLTKTTLF